MSASARDVMRGGFVRWLGFALAKTLARSRRMRRAKMFTAFTAHRRLRAFTSNVIQRSLEEAT